MAPRPGTVPSWATTGGTRLEPTAPEKASGHVAATRPPARKMNWLQGILADWIAYFATVIDSSEEHTYLVAKAQRFLVSLADMESQLSSFSITEWRLLMGSGGWTTNADSPTLVIPLNAYLRHGMVITGLTVMVQPGIARAGANRMSLELFYRATDHNVVSNNPVTPVSIGATFDNTFATKQSIAVIPGGGGHTVVREGTSGRDYYAVVNGGNNALGNVDTLFGALLQVNNPGPRNA